jgi:hypothetical protein
MSADDNDAGDRDLDHLLQELRILLQGSQLLTGFLIGVPFTAGFGRIDPAEKWVYLATFVLATTSLVLFSAPAAHHRIERPLVDLARFERFAIRMTLAGVACLSVSLVLGSQLVIVAAVGRAASVLVAGVVGALVAFFWWLLPLARAARGRGRRRSDH